MLLNLFFYIVFVVVLPRLRVDAEVDDVVVILVVAVVMFFLLRLLLLK